MSLRTKVLDALIDGHVGKGLIVTRQAVIQLFSDVAKTCTGVFLSNSEMTTGVSSPTYIRKMCWPDGYAPPSAS